MCYILELKEFIGNCDTVTCENSQQACKIPKRSVVYYASIAKFKTECQKIQYQNCENAAFIRLQKVAKTIVFIGNKNVNLSHPASITRLLDFIFKKIMVSAGVSLEEKTNIVLLTLTDPR